MKRAIVALSLVAPLLAACVEPEPPVVPSPDACGAGQFQYLVGKPGVLLDGMRFGQDVRVIQHGMAVTMDYRGNRLNFWLDRSNVIERVVCG